MSRRESAIWLSWLVLFVSHSGGCTSAETLTPLSPLAISLGAQAALAYPNFLVQPQIAEDYRQRGLAAREQGDFNQAIAAMKTAVALAPRHAPGYVLLGWTQHLADQRADAIRTLNQALDYEPDQVPALNALGIAYLVNGDLDLAIATHTQAKTLNPDNEIAYYNLSLAYQRVPDVPAAIVHARRATELEPYNPHPWVALALAYWSQPDVEAALAAYEQALSLDGRYYDAYHLKHLAQAGFSSEQIEQVDDLRQRL